jgi:hypothetical protein
MPAPRCVDGLSTHVNLGGCFKLATAVLILLLTSVFAWSQNPTLDEKQALIAKREATSIHHSAQYPSAITFTVVPDSSRTASK